MDDNVTYEDLLAALQAAATKPDQANGISFVELEELLGWNTHKIRKGLRQLQKAGRLEVGRAPRQNIAGSWSPVPVYRFKK